MKKFFAFLLVLVPVGVILYFLDPPLAAQAQHLVVFSACDSPIHYKVGSIDERFDISRSEFTQDIQDASAIWQQADGKEHFVYDANADLTILMRYDQRQYLDNQINNLQGQLNQENGQIKPQLEQYNQDSAAFKQKLAKLNSQIAYWNSQGGAPPDTYSQLISQQHELQAEADRLNAEAQTLNQATDQYNVGVSQLHQTVNTFNNALSQRPEEGLYDPNNETITLYFNNGHTELVHTLAHEMGHAIGLGHNSGQDSIMYPQTNDSLTPSTQDLTALTYACRKQTILTVLRDRIQYLVARYKATR